MKRYLIAALSLALALTLASCGAYAAGGTSEPAEADASAVLPGASQPEEDVHQPAQADNIVPHDPVGYCGNTVTTVSADALVTGEDWEVSFWGSDSVALTDLLTYLDYQEGICRCLPEYNVTTEFSEESYGIDLTSGYVRRGDSQVDLTEGQTELIRDILERNRPDRQ